MNDLVDREIMTCILRLRKCYDGPGCRGLKLDVKVGAILCYPHLLGRVDIRTCRSGLYSRLDCGGDGAVGSSAIPLYLEPLILLVGVDNASKCVCVVEKGTMYSEETTEAGPILRCLRDFENGSIKIMVDI